MDSGLSWADQWDYNNPDPPPKASADEKKKGKDGSKNKLGISILTFKWMKELRKKSHK
ncbi:uncharacterized protein LOC110826415 [Carica papaya]|uniref:uncharacterized protein LOC110826415 n=1 Tax=Carica papaya TaxID=3649 RepID=UPI000B8CFA14|nr:uncharacterized protein LOC110826415 [Carica papaya]